MTSAKPMLSAANQQNEGGQHLQLLGQALLLALLLMPALQAEEMQGCKRRLLRARQLHRVLRQERLVDLKLHTISRCYHNLQVLLTVMSRALQAEKVQGCQCRLLHDSCIMSCSRQLAC